MFLHVIKDYSPLHLSANTTSLLHHHVSEVAHTTISSMLQTTISVRRPGTCTSLSVLSVPNIHLFMAIVPPTPSLLRNTRSSWKSSQRADLRCLIEIIFIASSCPGITSPTPDSASGCRSTEPQQLVPCCIAYM